MNDATGPIGRDASKHDKDVPPSNDPNGENGHPPDAAGTAGGGALAADPGRRKRKCRLPVDENLVKDVLRLVEQIAPEAFAGKKEHRRKVLGARLIEKARGWGMTDPKDMAVFCALSRYPGERFFNRPVWLDAAERVKNGQTTWSDVYQEPQIWEEPEQESRA